MIVYSDGLTDAETSLQEHFGEERLRDTIRCHGPAGAEAIEQGILDALETFTEGALPQTDDITFVIIAKNAASAQRARPNAR